MRQPFLRVTRQVFRLLAAKTSLGEYYLCTLTGCQLVELPDGDYVLNMLAEVLLL